MVQEHAKDIMADLPYFMVSIMEYTDMLARQRQTKPFLVRLASKERTTGTHLVLATQRPDAATFSGQLHANTPSRIALTMQKASDSKIIIDDSGAERLTGQENMLIKIGQKTARVPGEKAGLGDIASAIADYQGRS